jgi:hypothetical protein
MRINTIAKEIHEIAKAHGWWDEERSFGEVIALIHSEASEALEAYREDNNNLKSWLTLLFGSWMPLRDMDSIWNWRYGEKLISTRIDRIVTVTKNYRRPEWLNVMFCLLRD